MSLRHDRRNAFVLQLAFLVFTWIWVAVVGCDISWDVINHHFYLPFSLLSGRYQSDLFAAGPQAYQNPVGYLPFYWMARGSTPSWVVGAALATLHAVAAWPLHRLTQALWGHGRESLLWRTLALALAWVTPVFLLFAGTSSTDPLTSVLVLLALSWLIGAPGRGSRTCMAGIAVGLAFAIKPSNAVFVLALTAVVLLQCSGNQRRWRSVVVLFAAMAIGAAAAMGHWSWWLWQTFGNPVFPLYNQVFHSPFAPQQAWAATRFLPVAATDYLTRPWQMAGFAIFSHIETFAPDLRPLMLLLTGAPALLLAAWRKRPGWRVLAASADVQLAVFCVVAYVLWMKTSGNSRYAIPLLMLVGVLLCRAVQTLLPAKPARVVLCVLLVLQLAYYGVNGEHRIIGVPWDAKPYVRADMPQRLVNEPFLHLSLGPLTYAGLAPLMNPQGALINLVGQLSMPTDGPLGQAVQQRLRDWRGRTRFLLAGAEKDGATITLPERRRRADALVSRHGLRFNFDDCLPIRTRSSGDGSGTTWLLSCGALPREAPIKGYAEALARADQVFANLEASCPRILGPSPMTSDGDQSAWQRRYPNTDARIELSFTKGVTMSHFRSAKLVSLGSADDVLQGRGLPPCLAWAMLFSP